MTATLRTSGRSGEQQWVSDYLVTEHCFKCGVLFAFPERLHEAVKRDKATFWCPNGHSQVYKESTEEELRRQLANAEESLRIERVDRERVQRDLRRALARTGNGLCPCCNRSFPQLADHIRTQHPDQVDHDNNPAGQVENSLGQRRCAGCERWISARSDGMVRRHTRFGRVSSECPGSGEEPIGGAKVRFTDRTPASAGMMHTALRGLGAVSRESGVVVDEVVEWIIEHGGLRTYTAARQACYDHLQRGTHHSVFESTLTTPRRYWLIADG